MSRVTCASPLASVVAGLCSPPLSRAEDASFPFPGPEPGGATSAERGRDLVLANRVLALTWSRAGGSVRLESIEDRIIGASIEAGGELFVIGTADGALAASDMRLQSGPAFADLRGGPGATVAGRRCGGKGLEAELVSPDGALRARWRAEFVFDAEPAR